MNEDYFYTSDLGLAAALVCSGFPIVGLNSHNPKRTRFHFEPSGNLTEATQKYWNNELNVRARAMFETLKMLKNRIYSE